MSKLSPEDKAIKKFMHSKNLISQKSTNQLYFPKSGFGKFGYDFAKLALKGDFIAVQDLMNEMREFYLRGRKK